VAKARRLEKIAYEEMLEMASLGAKVLQTRSVEIAMLHRVPTRVLSTFTPEVGGTLLCDEEDIVEKKPVTGIAYSRDEAKITLHKVPDKPAWPRPSSGPWRMPASMST
jgi:aspartate kinase